MKASCCVFAGKECHNDAYDFHVSAKLFVISFETQMHKYGEPGERLAMFPF